MYETLRRPKGLCGHLPVRLQQVALCAKRDWTRTPNLYSVPFEQQIEARAGIALRHIL